MVIAKRGDSSAPDHPFYSHTVEADGKNRIGIEGIGCTPRYRIRIDWVEYDSEASVREMLGFLEGYAKENRFKSLYFADTASESLVSILMDCGFQKIEMIGYDPNQYLEKKII